MFRSYRAKLTLFFVILITMVQIITLLAVYTITTRNVRDQIKDQLLYSYRIFNRQVEERARSLSDEARILAADFGFRSAVSSEDRQTILSALRNLGSRIGSDRAMLISMGNSIIVDTHPTSVISGPFPFPDIIRIAEENDQAFSVLVMDSRIFEFVIVPVLAPVPIAWIGIGFQINDMLASTLKNLAPKELDITYIHKSQGEDWHLSASTLNPKNRDNFPDLIYKSPELLKEPSILKIGDDECLVLFNRFTTPSDSSEVAVILHYNLATAMQPYQPLFMWLFVLSSSGMIITFFGAVLIARRVTEPVRILSNAALRIMEGDYAQPVNLTQKDEIGHLAGVFNHMMDGIANREEKITYQAYHDPLTELPNRLYFAERLKATIDDAQQSNFSFCLILVSINRFSEINNTLGHDTGDKLIQHIGDRLRKSIKQTDIIARLASDEFIMLLPNTRVELDPIMLRILGIFEEPFNIEGVNIDVSVHLGASCYPFHGNQAELLIQRADVAVYTSQQTANRYAIYDKDKDPYSPDRLSLMGELRQGLLREEFQIYYQPKIDIRTGRINGVESLIRWIHPTYGFLPPDSFIPLAEQTGYVHLLTTWILDKAIQQCSTWHKDGVALKVAVNLSVKDLLNKRLPLTISDTLKEYQLDPQWLMLEITESAIMLDPDYSLGVLKDLKDIGLFVSIDDFGTGYSSMAYLKKLAADELKIDQSFVRELASNPEDEIIVDSTISLGHSLGLKVIAEGVENQEALSILKRYKCDLAQGYFFSKPLPVVEFNQWLRTSLWGVSPDFDNAKKKAAPNI